MKKGQLSSTKAMAHYTHHDDEAKQGAQNRGAMLPRLKQPVAIESSLQHCWKVWKLRISNPNQEAFRVPSRSLSKMLVDCRKEIAASQRQQKG